MENEACLQMRYRFRFLSFAEGERENIHQVNW